MLIDFTHGIKHGIHNMKIDVRRMNLTIHQQYLGYIRPMSNSLEVAMSVSQT